MDSLWTIIAGGADGQIIEMLSFYILPVTINIMKSLKCDACEFEAQGEDFEAWFEAMHTHYASDHADLMKAMEGKPKEEGEKWMAEAKARFDAA